MSLELWKAIQTKVGAQADGIPGPATARRIADALGVKPVGIQTAQFSSGVLVTGKG